MGEKALASSGIETLVVTQSKVSSEIFTWTYSPLRVNLVSRELTRTQFAAKAVLRPGELICKSR